MLLAFGAASAKEYKLISGVNTIVTASSTESEMYPVSHLNDYDAESRWSSDWSDVQSVEMDFNARKPIDKIVLNWESAFARSIKIYGKKFNEQSSWELIYDANGTLNGGETVIEKKLGSFRILKFEMSERALQQYGISLYEIEVYSERNHLLAKEITLEAQSSYHYGQADECNSANHGKMVLVAHNYKSTSPHSYIKACLMNSYIEDGKTNIFFDWVDVATGAHD